MDKDKLKKLFEKDFKVELEDSNDVIKKIKDIEDRFKDLSNSPSNSTSDKIVPKTALVKSSEHEITSKIEEVPINEIKLNPYQPRKFFDSKKISELASSIKENGLFTPVILKKYSMGYYLIAGERRFRAAKELGLRTIKSIFLSISDNKMQEIALLENIQREDLNIIEEAQAYKSIIDRRNITHEKLSEVVSKSRSYITNVLGILKLPNVVKNYVLEGKLKMGHVNPIKNLGNDNLIIKIANRIISENLTARQVEEIAQGYNLNKMPKVRKNVTSELKYQDIADKISEILKTRVLIRKGKIQIKFISVDNFNAILKRFKKVDIHND